MFFIVIMLCICQGEKFQHAAVDAF